MDSPSDGVCIQYPRDLVRTEVRRQIMLSLFRDQAPDLAEWIWTKVGWLTGERFPVNEVA